MNFRIFLVIIPVPFFNITLSSFLLFNIVSVYTCFERYSLNFYSKTFNFKCIKSLHQFFIFLHLYNAPGSWRPRTCNNFAKIFVMHSVIGFSTILFNAFAARNTRAVIFERHNESFGAIT